MSQVDKSVTPVTPEETIMSSARIADAAVDTTAGDKELSTRRLNVMRLGYAFMGVGLAIVKWPLLLHAASLPEDRGRPDWPLPTAPFRRRRPAGGAATGRCRGRLGVDRNRRRSSRRCCGRRRRTAAGGGGSWCGSGR
jgi:hypothetical protein